MSKNKSGKKAKKKHALWIALHEYSYAEFSSAIEMIQAAKRCQDTNTAVGYIRHSLEEYRHTHLMRTVISKYIKDNADCYRDVRFYPNHVIKKGYVDPSNFLFQNYDFQRFSIFVGVNERNACTIFRKFQNRCAKTLKKCTYKNKEGEYYRHNIRLALETIEEIISDEHEHEKYALGYAKKSKFKIGRFTTILLWEIFSNRLRHFYASNNRINRYIASFVYFIVIALILPFRFVFRVSPFDMDNLISKKNSELML